MPSTVSDFYTVKQTSQILGFSTNSVYKFLKEGRLRGARGSRKQGRFRITRSSIESFLATPLTNEFLESKLKPTNTPPTNSETTQDLPVLPRIVSHSQPTPTIQRQLPLHLIRVLIILCLIAIIADILINPNFSLFPQIIRLLIIATLIILAYQFDDVNSTTLDNNHITNQHS